MGYFGTFEISKLINDNRNWKPKINGSAAIITCPGVVTIPVCTLCSQLEIPKMKPKIRNMIEKMIDIEEKLKSLRK